MLLSFFQFLFGENLKLFIIKLEEECTELWSKSLLRFRLLEAVLGYINAVAQSVEKNADKLTVKFWRALLSKAYDMLDKVGVRFSLFPMLRCCFYVIGKCFNIQYYLKNKRSSIFSAQCSSDFSWKRILITRNLSEEQLFPCQLCEQVPQ